MKWYFWFELICFVCKLDFIETKVVHLKLRIELKFDENRIVFSQE